jgi:hypothetical protein
MEMVSIREGRKRPGEAKPDWPPTVDLAQILENIRKVNTDVMSILRP